MGKGSKKYKIGNAAPFVAIIKGTRVKKKGVTEIDSQQPSSR